MIKLELIYPFSARVASTSTDNITTLLGFASGHDECPGDATLTSISVSTAIFCYKVGVISDLRHKQYLLPHSQSELYNPRLHLLGPEVIVNSTITPV